MIPVVTMFATGDKTGHISPMINSFKHKGVKNLFEKDDRRQIHPDIVEKVRRILAILDMIENPARLGIMGYRVHKLKGKMSEYWSIRVTSNWCLVFSFENGNVYDVSLVDYH